MLSEISQAKKVTVWFHTYMESKKENIQIKTTPKNHINTRTNWWLPEVRGWGDGWNMQRGLKGYRVWAI